MFLGAKDVDGAKYPFYVQIRYEKKSVSRYVSKQFLLS